jgi:putative peptide zinc metalloprotease protein
MTNGTKHSSEPHNQHIYITKNSTFSFHDLIIRKEGDVYIVGRSYSAVFTAMPPVGLELIELLKQNYSLAQVIETLSKKYKETIEIDGFIENLISKGFVKSIDGKRIPQQEKEFKGWFTGIKPSHVSWFFSKPTLIIYGIMILFAMFIMVLNPQYVPKYQDIFFHDWLTVVVVVSFLISWLLVFKHEMFHLFAAKSVGVDARISLGNRLHNIVVQTDITNVWSIERKKRYVVYLAGILSDILMISILIYYLWLSDMHILSYAGFNYRLAKMIILVEVFGIIFQFQFFMRTDIYYVIATKYRCKNLMQDARNLLKNKIHRIFPRYGTSVDQNDIPAYEMKCIRMYAVLFFFGTSVVLLTIFVFVIPTTILLFNVYIDKIVTGINTHTRYLYDGIAMIFTTLFYVMSFGYVLYKQRKEKVGEKIKPILIWIKDNIEPINK